MAASVLLVVMLVRVALGPPGWYRPGAVTEERSARAEAFEYDLMVELQRVRETPHAAWRLRVTEDQLNDWLVARLPRWLDRAPGDDGGDAVDLRPQVRVRPSGIDVAAVAGGRWFPLALVTRLGSSTGDTDGAAEVVAPLEIRSARAGRGGPPTASLAWVVRRFGDRTAWGIARDPRGWLAAAWAEDPVTVPGEGRLPAFALDDGRRIALQAVTPEDGAVVLHLWTVHDPDQK